uniref:Uncharacterized protein n=1 Tax=Phytophthora ramorum TaxID=164328 RepID=H3GRN9_PHYRM
MGQTPPASARSSSSRGAIAHIHGSSINSLRPPGPFNYYWVDDHINVAADIGSNCADIERSLRGAMLTVLGHGAINEAKFTPWCPRQKALGLIFDSQAGTVAMPASKIRVAQTVVAAALERTSLRRSDHRSLLGRLRHVVTCVRPARLFLQRLCQQECHLRWWQHVPVTEDMRADLHWWLSILRSPALNGVPLAYFGSCPEPDVVVEMDASDLAICTFVAADKLVLRYFFTPEERRLFHASKSDPSVGFDINYRELLSCAFAVHAWGQQWSSRRASTHGPPVHVRFKIDNMPAVAWQNKMAPRNDRAQTLIRLLGHWELVFGLRFSAMHVAGADNRIADAGSRSSHGSTMHTLFNELTRDWLQVPPPVDYRSALTTWFAWSTSRGIQPTLFGYTTDVKIQCITDFILHGFQHGYGSGRPVRGATISAVLHGVLHFFWSAALDFPSGHPQIRMLLKGISRLDAPPEIASKEKKFAWFALRAVDIAIFNSAGAATSVHIRLTVSKTNQRGAPTLLSRPMGIDTFKQYTRLCKESVETLATKIVSSQKRMQRLQ